jgi:hypothetical protein
MMQYLAAESVHELAREGKEGGYKTDWSALVGATFLAIYFDADA